MKPLGLSLKEEERRIQQGVYSSGSYQKALYDAVACGRRLHSAIIQIRRIASGELYQGDYERICAILNILSQDEDDG